MRTDDSSKPLCYFTVNAFGFLLSLSPYPVARYPKSLLLHPPPIPTIPRQKLPAKTDITILIPSLVQSLRYLPTVSMVVEEEEDEVEWGIGTELREDTHTTKATRQPLSMQASLSEDNRDASAPSGLWGSNSGPSSPQGRRGGTSSPLDPGDTCVSAVHTCTCWLPACTWKHRRRTG